MCGADTVTVPQTEVITDITNALVNGPAPSEVRIGLVIPRSGVMGLVGPAALAASILAAEQVNESALLHDTRLTLVPIDAGAEPEKLSEQIRALTTSAGVSAICGVHTSDTHRRIERLVAGRIPYLFTPPHEGGHRLPGVALMGVGPEEQLRPVAEDLARRRALRRWALIGSDYIWPEAIHRAAHMMLSRAGADVVVDELVPLGAVDPEPLISLLRRQRVQAVLLSLVGRDLAVFNRAFAESGLAGRVVRVSGALEETGLLEIDGDDTGDLYASMSWFASDDEGERLRADYAKRWGEHAPSLSDYAVGCYQGVHLLAGLAAIEELNVSGIVPGIARLGGRAQARLARAEGLELKAVRPKALS